MSRLEPEHPHEAGIEEEVPDQSRIEGAELLANENRGDLRKQGFTDDEIDEWALTYMAESGSGDSASFLTWIAAREHRH